MLPTLHGDTRVRCKFQPSSQSSQRVQLSLDGSLLTFQSRGGSIERALQQVLILGRRPERGQEVSDHRAAEAGVEQLLNLRDESLVLCTIDALATRRAPRLEQLLLLVVTKRPHAHATPLGKFTNAHAAILTVKLPRRYGRAHRDTEKGCNPGSSLSASLALLPPHA
jgi:hypothetical protein